jgi:hypothetical protein
VGTKFCCWLVLICCWDVSGAVTPAFLMPDMRGLQSAKGSIYSGIAFGHGDRNGDIFGHAHVGESRLDKTLYTKRLQTAMCLPDGH